MSILNHPSTSEEASPSTTSNPSQAHKSNSALSRRLSNVCSFAGAVAMRHEEEMAAMVAHTADPSRAEDNSPDMAAPGGHLLRGAFLPYVVTSCGVKNVAAPAEDDLPSQVSARSPDSQGYVKVTKVVPVAKPHDRLSLDKSSEVADQHIANKNGLAQTERIVPAQVVGLSSMPSTLAAVPWGPQPFMEQNPRRYASRPAQLHPLRQPTLPGIMDDLEIRTQAAGIPASDDYIDWSTARPENSTYPFSVTRPSSRHSSQSATSFSYGARPSGVHYTPENGVQSNFQRYNQLPSSSSPAAPGTGNTYRGSQAAGNTPSTELSDRTPLSDIRVPLNFHGGVRSCIGSHIAHGFRSPLANVSPSPVSSTETGTGGLVQNLDNVRIADEEALRIFRPMESRLQVREVRNQAQAYENMLFGFSPNYRGNIHLARNKSADIPSEKNCSLFLLGLNAKVTTHELLSSIRNVGRIYATHINKPEPDKQHMTCAAKVTFFERKAAERFFDMYNATGFKVHGHLEVARVLWNRIRAAESNDKPHRTRVLQIAGPPDLVNPEALTAYFSSKLEFQIDEIILQGASEERNVVEYRFGSYRCQAEAAKMALGREYPDGNVRTWHGPDPCDILDENGEAMPRY